MTPVDVVLVALPAGLAGASWWRFRVVHLRRVAEHADDVLAAADQAADPEPFWHAALAQVPAGIREELLPESERLATRLAAYAAPTVERPALSQAQAAGRFTEDVGGMLVERHQVARVRHVGPFGYLGLHSAAEAAVQAALRDADQVLADARAMLPRPSRITSGCQCPGCGTIPHA